MKRDTKCYQATEITYAFTKEEVVAALCEAHDLTMPHANTAAHSAEVWLDKDGVTVRFRWEEAAPQAPAEVKAA